MNNVMRMEYRALSPPVIEAIRLIKQKATELHELIAEMGASRELSLALTKVEEAVMWATKHLS